MGRAKRADEDGAMYHMLNRANRRATSLHKDADYEAFGRIIAEALDLVFSYCLMPNHWHLVVRPDRDGEMSRFGQWLGLTQPNVTTPTIKLPARVIFTKVATNPSPYEGLDSTISFFSL